MIFFNREQIQRLENLVNELKNENNLLKEKLQNNETEFVRVKNEIENEWNSKLENTTSEFRGKIRQIEDDNDEKLFTQTNELNKTISNLRNIIENNNKEINALKEEINQLNQQSNNNEEITELNNSNNQLKAENQRTVQQLNELTNKLDLTENELNRYKSENEELLHEVNELKEYKNNNPQKNTDNDNNNGQLTAQQINTLMQTIYTNLMNVFPATDGEEGEEENQYSSQDISKRCRKVFKKVSNIIYYYHFYLFFNILIYRLHKNLSNHLTTLSQYN